MRTCGFRISRPARRGCRRRSPTRDRQSRLDIAANAADREFWKPHIDDLLHPRPFRGLIYPYKPRDGRVRWFKISGQPLFAQGGVFLGYRGVGTDVTAEREAHDRLERQNLHFTAALSNMDRGISMFDAEQRLIVWNERYIEIYASPRMR